MRTIGGVGSRVVAKGVIGALVLGLLLVFAPRAEAHARLVKSSPSRNAELAKAPEQVDFWFSV